MNPFCKQYSPALIACVVITGLGLPAVAQVAAQVVESRTDATALNSHPLQPKALQPATGAKSKLANVALNPQPLPPKALQPATGAQASTAQRGIIIVSGRPGGEVAPALPAVGQKAAP